MKTGKKYGNRASFQFHFGKQSLQFPRFISFGTNCHFRYPLKQEVIFFYKHLSSLISKVVEIDKYC